MSASWRLARLRHLPSWPRTSQTATSARPASFSAATTFDPIKPAPPVTSNIACPCPDCADASFAPVPPGRQLGPSGVVKTVARRSGRFTRRRGAVTDRHRNQLSASKDMNIIQSISVTMEDRGRHPADPDRPLYVDRRLRARPHRGAGAEAALAEPAGRSCWPPRCARRWSITCRAFAPGSSGTCRAAGWRSPSNGSWRRSSAPRNYGTALVMPRTWKSAIAPALAGIPERVGFVGEARFGLLNRWRWGEKALPRLIDKNAALALPDGAPLPPEWPVPQLQRSRRRNRPLAAGQRARQQSARWRWRRARSARPSAGPIIRKPRGCWPQQGLDVWVVGGPGEKALAAEIVAAGGAARPRPHRQRSAQRHPGHGGGRRRDLERFRPDACRRRARDADHGHFRPHQPAISGRRSTGWRRRCRPKRWCRASPATARSAA